MRLRSSKLRALIRVIRDLDAAQLTSVSRLRRAARQEQENVDGAYHEAGHAVAAVLLGLDLFEVSLVDQVTNFGMDDTYLDAVASFAGPAAERFFGGTRWHHGAALDVDAVLRQTRDPEWRTVAWSDANALVAFNQQAIRRVAYVLLAAEFMTGRHVSAIIEKSGPIAFVPPDVGRTPP